MYHKTNPVEDTIESVDEEAVSLDTSPKQVQRLALAGRQKSMPTELRLNNMNSAFTQVA